MHDFASGDRQLSTKTSRMLKTLLTLLEAQRHRSSPPRYGSEHSGPRRYPEMWFLLKVLVFARHNLKDNFWCSNFKGMGNLLPVTADSCSLYAYSMSRHLNQSKSKPYVGKDCSPSKLELSSCWHDLHQVFLSESSFAVPRWSDKLLAFVSGALCEVERIQESGSV